MCISIEYITYVYYNDAILNTKHQFYWEIIDIYYCIYVQSIQHDALAYVYCETITTVGSDNNRLPSSHNKKKTKNKGKDFFSL